MQKRRRIVEFAEEFWGCSRLCGESGRHTKKDGCAQYVPPCEHPVESICIESDGSQVVCGECREGLTVQTLVDDARVALSVGGCTCRDACVFWCAPATPTAWTLDPAKVLKVWELNRVLDD